THKHIATGLPDSKFGVDAAEASAMYLRARKDKGLKAVGIHSHIGSQITQIEPYRKAMAALLDLVAALASQGQGLRFLDIGGGLGVKYENEKPISLLAFSQMVAHEMRAWPEMELCLEPGRYLVAEAGVLLTRVLYRKSGGRSRLVIV